MSKYGRERFLKERNHAFMKAVLEDDWRPVYKYCRRYGVPIPKKEDVMKAGIYKAVQEVTDIPERVKDLAREKCVAMGFKPTMWEGFDG